MMVARLTLVSMVARTSAGPQQRLDFGYDWRGRRIMKKVWNNTEGTGAPSVDRLFAYDGWNLIATLNSQLSTLNSFAWGLDLSGSLQGAGGVGGLLWVNDASNGSTHLASFDGNGNVVAFFNATDNSETARYEYGPFGEVVRMTGQLCRSNPFRFSTKYQDDETDLLYYGYRYYHPSTGRWVSRDPLEELDGPGSVLFLRNSPLIHHDLLGLAGLPRPVTLVGGHHRVPWSPFTDAFGPGSDKVFLKVLNTPGVSVTATSEHNFYAHGEYNRRVRAIIDAYKNEKKIACGCVTEADAREILRRVDISPDPYIKGFNANVKSRRTLEKWMNNTGEEIIAAERRAIREAKRLAGRKPAWFVYAKRGGKLIKFIGVGTFIYTATQEGVRAATEQEMLDLIFAREIQAGGRIMVDTVEEFFKPVTFEERCRASGIEDDDEWP
jgi:RHS repeat-associated protein